MQIMYKIGDGATLDHNLESRANLTARLPKPGPSRNEAYLKYHHCCVINFDMKPLDRDHLTVASLDRLHHTAFFTFCNGTLCEGVSDLAGKECSRLSKDWLQRGVARLLHLPQMLIPLRKPRRVAATESSQHRYIALILTI